MPWLDPDISLRWGPYTRLDGDEQGKIVTMTVAAKQAGLITKRMAVEKFADAGVFDVENVDATLKALDEEQAQDDKREADKAATQAENDAKTLHAAAKVNGGQKPGAPGQRSGPGAAPKD